LNLLKTNIVLITPMPNC